MCFSDNLYGKIYIEEITGGHLEFISDDSLAESLMKFLEQHNVLDMSKPMLPDNKWLKPGISNGKTISSKRII
jgi:hypothetical protein